jgi:DNA end-binding protein Ku
MATSVSLGFGLVNIPIKIFAVSGDPASAGKTHNVHSVCNTQLKQPKTCPKCMRAVTSEEIISGYSYSKTELVPLTKEDLAQIPLASTRNLAVTEFVPAEKVAELRLIDKVYVIGPGDEKPNTIKAFSLFNVVMGEKREVGISKISFKGSSEHLCFIRSGEEYPEYRGQGVMILQLCPWPALLRDTSNVGISVPVSEKEKMLAMALIGSLHTDEVDLTKFVDGYEEALLDLVERKRSGEDVSVAVEVPEPAEDTSLLDMLMASVK